MDKYEVLKEKPIKILFIIFLLLTVINIIYASFVQRGISFDGSIFFVDLLDKFSNNKWLYTVSVRPRHTIYYLWQTPVNLAYHVFGIHSKYWLGVIYSLPLFALPAIFTFANYFLARKTKRLDLFVIAIAIYALFIIPTSYYPVVEILLAAPIFFLLFHYTVAETDYKNTDIFIIAFLIAVSYRSSEVVSYSAVILLFAAIYYARKTTNIKNKLVKYFIAINSIIMPIFYVNFYRNIPPDFLSEDRVFVELTDIKYFFVNIATSVDYLCIALITIIVIFCNKQFLLKKSRVLIYILFAVLFLILKDIYLYSNAFMSRRIIFFAIFPITMLLGLLIGIFKSKTDKEKLNNVLRNSLVVIILSGIINTIFQIQCSYLFDDSIEELNHLTSKNKHSFIIPQRDLKNFYNEPFNNCYFNCDTYSFDSIAFNRNYKIEKIIIYDETNPNCPHEFYFSKNELNLPFAIDIDVKNKFWDMSSLQEKLKNNNVIRKEIEDRTDTTSYDKDKDFDYIFDLEL